MIRYSALGENHKNERDRAAYGLCSAFLDWGFLGQKSVNVLVRKGHMIRFS